MEFAKTSVANKKPFLIYLAHHAVHMSNQSRPATFSKYETKKQGAFHHRINPPKVDSKDEATLISFPPFPGIG